MKKSGSPAAEFTAELSVAPNRVKSDGVQEVEIVCRVRDENGKPPADGATVKIAGPLGLREEKPLMRGVATVKYKPSRPTGKTKLSAETPWGTARADFFVEPTGLQLVREYVLAALIAIGMALFIRQFFITAFWIPSGSMEPTLYLNDKLIASRVHYWGDRSPKRGDIVIFKFPDDPKHHKIDLGFYKRDWDTYTDFIKRVVAVGGDTVEVRDGLVYVNGEPQKEDYIKEPPEYNMRPVKVEKGNLFVMGDNRNNSKDSHVWGQLDADRVIAKALFLYWPLDRIRIIH